MQWLIDHIAEGLIAALLAIAAWIAKRTWGLDGRVRALEHSLITHDQIDELRHSMIATFNNGHERTEKRLDEILLLLAKEKR